jgi:hypothetical protein
MTSARIEELIRGLEQLLANHPNHIFHKTWEGRREQYVTLLKERAEDGTYDTAGVVDQKTEAYR